MDHLAALEQHMIDEMTQDFADIVAAAIDGDDRCLVALATWSRYGPAPHRLAEEIRAE